MARFVYMGSLSRRVQQKQRAKSCTHTRLQSPAEVIDTRTLSDDEFFARMDFRDAGLALAQGLLLEILDDPETVLCEELRGDAVSWLRTAREYFEKREREARAKHGNG